MKLFIKRGNIVRIGFGGKKSLGLVMLSLRYLWDGVSMRRNYVGYCIDEFKV